MIKAMKLSTAGMRVQGTRLRVISENIENADALPDCPGNMPCWCKHIAFKNVLDRNLDSKRVVVDKIKYDKADLDKKFDP